jgi:hypothetical protein
VLADGDADSAQATTVNATAGTPVTPHIPHTTAAAAAMVAGTFAARAAAADTKTMPTRAVTRAIVPCECPAGVRIPMPGDPLFVVDGTGKYRGSVVNRLATANQHGFFCGIVFHTQPAQTMRHRGIALIAVTSDGSTHVNRDGIPGSPYIPATMLPAGVYVSPNSVVLRNTFLIRSGPDGAEPDEQPSAPRP